MSDNRVGNQRETGTGRGADKIYIRIESLWRWLQGRSESTRVGFILIICFVSGTALELLAEYSRSALQIQPWDPASGLYVVFLFGWGLRYAPVLFLIALTKSLLWSIGAEYTLPGGIAAGLYLWGGYYSASYLLLYRVKIDPGLRKLRDVLWFTGVFAIVSLIMSSLYTATLVLMKQMLWSEWLLNTLQDWAGEITGIMVLAPPLLILLRSLPWSNQHLTLQAPAPTIALTLIDPKEAIEWVLSITAAVAFTWLAFGGLQAKSLEYSYLTFVPLIWVAARHGFEKTTVITLSINISAVVFAEINSSPSTLALQFGLVTLTFTGVLLGAYVKDRDVEIAQRQILEADLSYQATHDDLTGLYNRTWLRKKLSEAIARAQLDKTYLFALLFLDLDRFKGINDRLGHLMGDRLLVAVGERIIRTVPTEATVARFGGDEFAVVLDRLTNLREATCVAQQLCKTLASVYSLEAYEAFTTVSIGITSSVLPYQKTEEMLRDADIALYEAKRKGRDQAVVFNRQMYETVLRRSQLEDDLRQAIQELTDD